MSHTVKVKVQLSDTDSLSAAVIAMGGSLLGVASHKLYGGNVQGFGFRLPNWRYPLVLQPSGELAYDDYNGRWGNVSDIDKLTGRYAIHRAHQAAEQLGWMAEFCAEGLRVYHPSGGTLVVTADQVDALGFSGGACAQASQQLSEAMGKQVEATVKPEFYEQEQEINASE